MLIHEIVNYCNDKYCSSDTEHICENCHHPTECSGNCKECLEQVHYPTIHQISKISLSPDVVDGIVFWTKNPTPMLERIHELDKYTYYFQFTLNSYGKDVEKMFLQRMM